MALRDPSTFTHPWQPTKMPTMHGIQTTHNFHPPPNWSPHLPNVVAWYDNYHQPNQTSHQHVSMHIPSNLPQSYTDRLETVALWLSSKQWTHYLSQKHPDLDPTKFFTIITQHVWTYVLELWTTCNTDNTLATAMIPQNNMMSEIQGILAARDCLPQHTQDRIFTLTKGELINKPKQYIQNWITHIKIFIQNKLKILAKQQWANTQDIWQFFQPQ